MNNVLWDRIAEMAQGKRTTEAVDLALALIELRDLVSSLNAGSARNQESLHHIDKQLGKLASACNVSYSRVTAELVGD
ncbi:MAG TPA: hypothetical protein VHC22_23375 [Pirellulales bacterium]|nr:hypothetical protein [Pirellulales bacterium]